MLSRPLLVDNLIVDNSYHKDLPGGGGAADSYAGTVSFSLVKREQNCKCA